MRKKIEKNRRPRKRHISLEDEIPQKRKKRIIHEDENSQKSKSPIKRFFIKIIIFFILITIIVSSCFLAFKGYVFKKLVTQMFNNSPSVIYDANKNIIAEIGSERIRSNASFSDIPTNLVNAYVSIEDQRYYSHYGVDLKRTGAAILSYIFNKGSSSFGGSTITQQLVKNLTGDDEDTAQRKIKEWFYAVVLNFSFSKEEILEAYLNIIYTGPSIYGVKEAAIYYFDKDIKDLTLEECAYLAGLNNSPNSYNPFSGKDNAEKITKRTKTVLSKMLELGYISEDNFNNAIKQLDSGLNFKKGETKKSYTINSYHSDAVINEVISDLQKKYKISKDFATNFYSLAGVSIYSTVNSDVQSKLEKEFADNKYVIASSNGTDSSQSAMVIIDINSGYVIGCCRWPRNKKIIKNI